MECRAACVDRFPDHVRAQYNETFEAIAAAMDGTVDKLEATFSLCLHLDPTRVRSW